MSVVQLAKSDDVVKKLAKHMENPGFERMSKKKLLYWIDHKRILDLYEQFHGENSGNEGVCKGRGQPKGSRSCSRCESVSDRWWSMAKISSSFPRSVSA